jgi:hypothetical protein
MRITDIVPTNPITLNTGLPSISLAISPLPEITLATPSLAETMTLKFYVFDESEDPDFNDCTAPSFVYRALPKSTTPLRDGVNYLIHTFTLTDAEKALGLNNYFEDPEFAARKASFVLKSASITNKVATLTFEDPQYYSSGGSCRSGILSDQISNTAKQFPTVTTVTYLPEYTLFQP